MSEPQPPVRRLTRSLSQKQVNGAAVTVPAGKLLEDQDPVLLELLRLAAEVILANPGAVPAGLYDQCDDWAGALAAALSRPPVHYSPCAGAASGEPPECGQPAAAGAAVVSGQSGRGVQMSPDALAGDLCTAFSADAVFIGAAQGHSCGTARYPGPFLSFPRRARIRW